MPSHVHMIIGSKKNKLEDIVRDMKSHTSTALKKSIKENPLESRKAWMVWLASPDSSGMESRKEKWKQQ